MSRIRCDACRERLTVEGLLASELWERIARGRYALCLPCIEDELVALGLSEVPCVLVYRGRALASINSPATQAALRAWRPSQQCVERSTVGNPLLVTDGGVF